MRRIALFAGLAAVSIVLAATATASGKSKYPPCTKKALNAGLKRGSAAQKNAKVVGSFGCARGWAYSAILVGGNNGFEAIAVYRAKNGLWVTVHRAKPCRTHAIPTRIYRGACTTS